MALVAPLRAAPAAGHHRLSILSGFFVLLGTILLVLPGIYLYVSFAVAVPVLLVEGAGPWRALGRSRRLVQGRWWGTFGVALVGYLLVTIVTRR